MQSQSIAVTGHTSLDYIFKLDNFAEINGSASISEFNMYYGGGAANVSIALSKLGQKSKLITPIGNDFYTTGYYKELDKYNVDLSSVYKYPNEQLSKAFVFTNKNKSQMTYFYWGVASHLHDLEPPKLDFVHISTASSSFNYKVSMNSKFVSFDPGQDLITYTKKDLDLILENVDILFLNRYEMELLCKISGKKLKDIIDIIDPVIVTKDIQGSLLYTKNEIVHIPSIITKTIDPTGAGDAYKAGFLAAYMKKYPLETCCKVGSIVSSFTIESIGCQTNLPTWEQMKKRYIKNYNDDNIF